VPYTLLLADDSVTIQRVIELTFADEDVTVVAVSDGDQAIARLEASPPDIVLADIGMPGKNGYEVAQYIRQSPKLAHIPVVLLTGAFEPVDQARADAAGCDGVLAKPFEPQMVIGRVKELLARPRRDPETRTPEAHPARPDEGDFQEPRNETPVVDPPVAATPAGPVPRNALNDYFDRLDAAFSTLPSNAPGQAPTPAEPIAGPAPVANDTNINWFETTTAEGASAEPWDLPAPPSDTEPLDLPLWSASPQPEASFAPAAEAEPVAEVAPVALAEEVVAPAQEVAAPEPEAAIVQPEPAATVIAAPVAPLAPPAPFEPVAPAAASAVPALELPLHNPPPLPALADAFAALLAAEQGEPQSSTAGTWPASLPPAAAVRDELIEDVTRRVLARLSDTVVRQAVADVASTVAERLIREEIDRIKSSIK
jgi:CheY-like chemotaxis protein